MLFYTQIAIFLARENPLNVSEMDNSPITSPPTKPKEAVFGLQLICQENHPLIGLSHKYHLHPDAIWTPIAVYYVPIKKSYLMVRLPVIELDLCPMSPCQQSKVSLDVVKDLKYNQKVQKNSRLIFYDTLVESDDLMSQRRLH